MGPYYWPDGLPRGIYSVENYVDAFRTVGFTESPDGTLVEGVEKIVIYGMFGIGKHAAKQLPDGRWASKLGKNVDIEHMLPDSLEGTAYGQVVVFMEKPRTDS